MSVCLGIDLGGSGTRAALGQPDGTVLAVRRGGRDALREVLGALVACIGDPRCLVHLGLAGLSRPGRREWAVRTLAEVLPEADVEISHDAAVALWGALPDGEGVAVLAGTGSIALARAADGREARAGGHGFLLGDDGSAFWLGREAVRGALAAAEGRGPPTQLTEVVSARLGLGGPGRLPPTRRTVERLAALAPLVSETASQGDPVAEGLLARAALSLSELGVAAARQVWGARLPDGLQVATCGGVWDAGPKLRAPFAAAIAREFPRARVVAPALPPVGGALLLACRRADPPDTPSVERLADGLARC